MINHPDYVQKVINEDPTASEKVRYIYPLPEGVKTLSKMEYGFDTEEGCTVFEFHFDFVPVDPTDADYEAALPHDCRTCLLRGFHDCSQPYGEIKECCEEWEYCPQAWDNPVYYSQLHMKQYGEKLRSR